MARNRLVIIVLILVLLLAAAALFILRARNTPELAPLTTLEATTVTGAPTVAIATAASGLATSFPAPADDSRTGDPTLPTRTPTPPAGASDTGAAEQLPSPDCDGVLTVDNPEGPYYTAGSPERASLLEAGMAGERLVVSGYVLGPDCAPVAGAWLDFWHADADGNYDNSGYRLRGHQITDANGRYNLETILPGLYPGRTRHIHVKVQAPNGTMLTTQLYFPGEPQNATDTLYRSELEMAVQPAANGQTAVFDFTVPLN